MVANIEPTELQVGVQKDDKIVAWAPANKTRFLNSTVLLCVP
eukprot:COSAG06_NODE_41822_length_387_cov_1.045139_1_plen_41_part_01